ncbi:MAG: hypothetical protein O7J95_05830, partial [Planctomycetota bacterium]|nr:hypothetical protein [Planctomycetota bacterium]
TSRLSAALWLPHNLITLVSGSDAIVLAENVGTRTVTDSQGKSITLTRYRLTKVYKGPLLAGEVVELRDWYGRGPCGWWGQTGKKMEYDEDAIVFLSRFDANRHWTLRNLGGRDRPRFNIAHSGLRLLAKRKVYTFDQSRNPGPVCPTPLLRGHDFRPGEGQVTLEEFEWDIRQAILRVETVRYARDLSDGRKRREMLLGLLQPYEEIVGIFSESGDIEGALEVFDIWPWESVKLDTNTALEAAANAAIEPRLRAAAIGTIDWSNFDRRQTIEALEKLLDERDGTVRAAAAARLRYLHRGYEVNTHRHEPELTSLWKRVLERLGPESKGSRRKE